MNYWKSFLFGLTIAANCLLGFFLIFYDRLVVPGWLQVAGRMHPLFLHFPIVLLVISVSWILFGRRLNIAPALFQSISEWMLLLAAVTCAIAALMGIFLSKEAGYNPEILEWHKWSGIFISWLTLLWYWIYDRIAKFKLLSVTAIISLVIILFTGHEGAGITHGENFLLAPIENGVVKKPSFDEAVVFTDMVKPILYSKCMSCHNSKKAKGELVLETQELILKGGRTGKLWDTTKSGFGLLFDRIHLPLEEKKHMPPNGKTQLTEEEKSILYFWVKGGADFKIKVRDLSQKDTLQSIARDVFKSAELDEVYDFEAANEKTVDDLNTNYRVVSHIAKESPALAVDFYGAAFFKADQLKDLLKIKDQIVSLNLNKMPVVDDDLKIVAEFIHLRELNLSFTKITAAGISYLLNLTRLKSISLSNTKVGSDGLERISALKELSHIYVWNTPVTTGDIQPIRKKYPGLQIEIGVRTDTILSKLNPPILENEDAIIDTPIRLKLKHYVPGITIRYTLDGSEPDSIHSPVYDSTVQLSQEVQMKARAFKPNWLGSEDVQFQFYHASFHPDTIIMNKPPDSLYKGKGGRTLHDNEKGDYNFGSGKWLAFRKNPMECTMDFSKPIPASSITISSLVSKNALVFPPNKIEIWGGASAGNLRLLGQMVPDTAVSLQTYLTPFKCKWKPTNVRFIKVVVIPIANVPKFIPNPKKQKGWFFVDELFVN